MSLKPFVLAIATLCVHLASGQVHTDTLSIKLDSAEKLFLGGNFILLAQKYNIQSQKALEIQAKLYPNPNLSVYYSLYNTQTKKFFPAGSGTSGGELSGQISQLIYLAGQRNKQVRIAEANTRVAEYQFYDLIRTLKYTLRTDFYNIYFLLHSAAVYNEEIKSLQQVVNAFEEQEGKGYIAEKEVIRIKAQLYTLLGEYNSLIGQINDEESELRLVLQVKGSFITPELDSAKIGTFSPSTFSLATLLDSAYNNRADLLMARTTVEASNLNYNYQKALAVPNLTLALAYDQQGSYINNLTSLGAAIDLPFFNRNKGNILAAKITTAANSALQQSTEATVQENVSHALEKAFANDKMYRSIDPKFLKDFDHMLHEVLINYEKRNLTLLDFLDFYSSYKDNILSSNNIQFNRISSFEDINYYTGTEFYQP
ncbi:MAG TPA: TolC family protein [Puia sp.]|nr:TolC family protein [Puia sp.]